MKLLQIQPDSTNHLLEAVSEMSQAAGFNIEFWVSIGMPIILLIICSLLKYTLVIGPREVKVFELFTEMAIDMLPIFGAFIVGRFFLESSNPHILLSSILMIGIISVVTIIVTILRQVANRWKVGSNPKVFGAFGFLVLEYSLAVGCIILIFNI